ncbi:MAG: potassium channel family protein [Bacteriovoracaceae bacterium]|jgi:voltage-gated potassium channel
MDKFQEKKKRIPLVLSSFSSFFNEVYLVLKSPAFLLLTFMGNGIILVSSCLFYYFEKTSNPNIKIFLDALWWGVATATTTGYGDITPVTIPGKILGICLMLVGLAFFGMFTALFAEAILTSNRKNRS